MAFVLSLFLDAYLLHWSPMIISELSFKELPHNQLYSTLRLQMVTQDWS